MKINIPDKDSFVSKFLAPINKVAEDFVVKRDKANPNLITCLVNSPCKTVVLYATYLCSEEMEPFHLNINRGSRLINAINSVPDNKMTIEVIDNHMRYTSKTVRFKHHFLDDEIDIPKIDIEKVKKCKFDVAFSIPQTLLVNIVKAGGFATDTKKIYFYSEGTDVYAELTDRLKDNTDSYGRIVSSNIRGDLSEAQSVSFELLRWVSTCKFDSVNALINTQNSVFLFDVSDEKTRLNYIASGYTG